MFELGTDGPRLVLVAVDGSRTALRAAAYAAGLARRQGCPLAVLYVSAVPTATDAGLTAAVMETSRTIAADLEALVREGATDRGVDAAFYVRQGDRAHEISALADELKADLVVVGASEKAGHRIIGSLATRLVHSGRWPVTVVP
jgi:nucleotide-binding universal stress UspA family protein